MKKKEDEEETEKKKKETVASLSYMKRLRPYFLRKEEKITVSTSCIQEISLFIEERLTNYSMFSRTRKYVLPLIKKKKVVRFLPSVRRTALLSLWGGGGQTSTNEVSEFPLSQ